MRRSILQVLLFLCVPMVWAATVNITYLGDSLTYGAGLTSPSTQSYPRLVQNLALAAGLDWTSKNAGVSGNTSAQGLARLPALLALDPDWLFVELGANDGLRGYSIAGTKANLISIIQSAQAAGVGVILGGMQVPVTGTGLNTSTAYTEAFAAIYPEIARQLNVPLMPWFHEDVGGIPSLNQSDGIHPTAAGHAVIAQHVFDYARPQVTGSGKPAISVTRTANASEIGPQAGVFTITRTGSTATSWAAFYDLTGVAAKGSDYTTRIYDIYGTTLWTPGVDYASGKGYVFIPTGASSTTLIVTPVGDALVEGNETVVLTTVANPGYSLAAVATASMTIADTAAVPAAPVVTSATMATATVGTAFSYAITGSNSPTSFAATALPAGLTLNPASGVISGTPTVAGTMSVTIQASNAGGTGSAVLALTVRPAVPVVTSATTASGVVGTAFSYTITASNSPASFAATNLPSGLSMHPTTGVISGTPTVAAVQAVTISATNISGTGTRTLTLTITAAVPAAPVVSSATTATATVGTAFSYAITGSNSPTSFAATGLPAGLTLNPASGVISGTPTAAGTMSVTIRASNAGGTGSCILTLTVRSAAGSTASTSGTAGGAGCGLGNGLAGILVGSLFCLRLRRRIG